MEMYALKGEQHEDLIFDDKTVLSGNPDEPETVAEIKDEKEKTPAETTDTLIEDKSPKKWIGLYPNGLTEPSKGRYRCVAAMPFLRFQL